MALGKKQWRCALCHEANPHTKRDICEDCEAWLKIDNLAWCSGRKLRAPHRVKASDIPAGRQWCRACQRAYQQRPHIAQARSVRAKSWRERNLEHVKAYLQRPDRVAAEKARRQRRTYGAAEQARRRQNYLRRRQEEIARAIAWRKNHPERAHAIRQRYLVRRKLRVLHAWKQAV